MDKYQDTTRREFESDFEQLKTWKDNSDLDYYLSEEHWNYHVNTLLYKNLLVFYEGKELGAFLDVSGDYFTQPIRDYNPLYGNLFNEAYRLCSKVLTTPVPQTKVAWFAEQAATWKFRNVKDEDGNIIEIAPNVTDLIESYHILGMVNAILTFSDVQKETLNEFLIALSVYKDKGLFLCGHNHCFEPYNEVYEEFILATMVDGTMLHPKYDNKRRDEYLRHNIPWYEHLAGLFEEEKEKQKSKEQKVTSIYEQENHSSGQEDSNSSGNSKPGRTRTSFKDFVVNTDECNDIISLIKEHINKDNPKQVALVIMGGIEAGKIRQDITAPSIEKEFGVNGNSVKPHLTKYRAYKNGQKNSFSEDELEPYKNLFIEQK